MITTASLLLLFASCTSAFVLPARTAAVRCDAGRHAAGKALDPSGRWSDPILDDSLPDPVFDDDDGVAPGLGDVAVAGVTVDHGANGIGALERLGLLVTSARFPWSVADAETDMTTRRTEQRDL